LFQLHEWVGLTGLAVSDRAVYAIANYGEEKKAYLLVLDRNTLQEAKRIPLPQVASEDGPRASALIGNKLYFPASRTGDATTDTELGVVDLATFATSTIDLAVASPYILRAVGSTLYIAHTSMNIDGHQITALDTATGKLTHRDVGFDIVGMDASDTTLAVVGYADGTLKDSRLALYQLPSLTKLSDSHPQAPAHSPDTRPVAINVFTH
jgi:hypothetical protein